MECPTPDFVIRLLSRPLFRSRRWLLPLSRWDVEMSRTPLADAHRPFLLPLAHPVRSRSQSPCEWGRLASRSIEILRSLLIIQSMRPKRADQPVQFPPKQGLIGVVRTLIAAKEIQKLFVLVSCPIWLYLLPSSSIFFLGMR